MEWTQWAIGAGVVVAVAALLRAFPKEKIAARVNPIAGRLGSIVSALLLSRLPRAAAERVEEGIICTFVSVLGSALLSFESGLLADNKSRRDQKNKPKEEPNGTDSEKK